MNKYLINMVDNCKNDIVNETLIAAVNDLFSDYVNDIVN